MSRTLLALAAVAVLSSCGGGPRTPPRDLENACAIVAERPKYLRAMRRAERQWGVPVPVQMAVIHQESKFIGDARTPHRFMLGVVPMGRQSTAFGYAQALDGTWDEYRAESGRRRADRDDIWDATDFMGWYMHKTESGLGVPKTDARSQYLAYHEGRSGFARGTHNRKAWLLEVASSVNTRAERYAQQLMACRRWNP
jgi:hypothetical protein